MELYPHQQHAVDKLHNGAILVGGVGTGKSMTSLAYYYTKVLGGVMGDQLSVRRPTDIYIITTAKKRDHGDWEKDAINFGLVKDPELSVGNVRMTIDSWNNIGKYKHVTDAFFIFDEQRLVGSGQWSKDFITIARANKWILLSATPGDTWLDYIPVFIANGFYKNRTEFKRQHVVYNTYSKFPKVDRYVDVGVLVRHRNSILVEMPYERHTTRHSVDVEVDFDKDLQHKALAERWHVYEGRPLRDVAELFLVLRKIVNSHPSRLAAVRKLMTAHPKLIVFYNFDFELEALRTLITDVPVAEWNGHKHQAIPDTERWVYLVQYAAGSEGWNCIDTDSVCFYSLTYSYKMFHQAHGRIDRLNTPFSDLYYYILISNSVIDQAIRKALKMKKSFNESSFMAKK